MAGGGTARRVAGVIVIVDLLRYDNFVVCYRVLFAADYITRNQEQIT